MNAANIGWTVAIGAALFGCRAGLDHRVFAVIGLTASWAAAVAVAIGNVALADRLAAAAWFSFLSTAAVLFIEIRATRSRTQISAHKVWPESKSDL